MKIFVKKSYRSVLSLMLSLLMIMSSVSTAFAMVPNVAVDTDGDGMVEIDTTDKLYWFAQEVNNGKTTLNAELTADIIINENVLVNGELNSDSIVVANFKKWTPIGNNYKKYAGVFDGNSHTIRGIYCDIVLYSGDVYAGVFGCLNGTVKNIGVVDSYIRGIGASNAYVGGICGWNDYGTITNCYNTDAVRGSASDTWGHTYVGGNCGRNYGIITNCYNTGMIICKGKYSDYSYAGGISGENYNTISNCHNIGEVTPIGEARIGGICGENYDNGTIINCYNTVSLSCDCTKAGICGWNSGKIKNCYNTGDISGQTNFNAGICGLNDDYGIIENCYNNGAVSGTTSNGQYDNAIMGGICGKSEPNCKIITCYNNGTINVKSTSANVLVGGICGWNNYGTMENCYNTGSISGTTRYDNYVGGICGDNSHGTIINCYNVGSLSGGNHTDGICGMNNSTITNCYKNNVYGTGGGTKCTNEQMQNQETYVGFDFENIWIMDETRNYLFPLLRNNFTGVLNINGIIILNPPKKIQYNENSQLDLTGGVLKVLYDNDLFVTVPMQNDMVTGFDNTKAGKQTLTVTYKGFTTTFDIEILAKSAAAINVTALPTKTEYTQNKDSLDLTGAKLKVTYDNGTNETIDITSDMVTGFDNSKLGVQTLTVTYKGITTTFDVEIVPVKHIFGDWVVDKEPTCTETGSKHRTCTDCGETETAEIPALGHDFSTIWTTDREATCNTPGEKSHHCSRCDVRKDITEIPVTDHVYGGWILETAPTCTKKGKISRICKICGRKDCDIVQELGHDFSTEWTVDKEATCTEDGIKSHHCTRCNAKKDETVIPATGHSYSSWKITKEETCLEPGEKTRVCSVCNHTETMEIPAHGHVYSKRWTIDKEPTCLTEGFKSHHCLYCDAKTDETVIPVGGHIFGKWYIEKEATMDTPGIKAHKCYNCDLIEREEIPKLKKYTATFIADGEVVAKVDFPEDAKTINEPPVPQKNRYTGKWEAYTPENKNIVINAEYTHIESTDIDKIITEHTADYYGSTGEVEVHIGAKSPSKNIIVNSSKRVPLDIVLVLDQSGSMADINNGISKRQALVNAVNNFNNSVLKDSVDNGVNHRIAIVGFGMGSDDFGYQGSNDYIKSYCNTNILTTGGDPVPYNEVNDTVYANAFKDVKVDGALNPDLTFAVNNIGSKGATMANLGLEMASAIFAHNIDENREKVVVFLTDGEPTSGSSFEYGVANAALHNAYQLKNTYDATIYSVGIFDDNTASSRNVNNFMNYVSSNYADKHILNKKRPETTPAPSGYYMKVSDTSKLDGIFKSIVEENVVPTGEFDNVTLEYTLTKYFTMTSVQEDALRALAVKELKVNEEDVVVTRNHNNTTTIKIINAHPELVGSNWVADITFRVTANGETRRSGTYPVNTLDSGVILDGCNAYEEVFVPKDVDITGTSGIATFTINGVPYHIERLKSSDSVVAPITNFGEDYTFSGWNIPENHKLNNQSETFDAALTKNKYRVTWIVDGEKTEEYYAVGDEIKEPTVKFDATGDLFKEWDSKVPYEMPAEDLIFTAIYEKHYHNFVVTKDFNDCTKGGTIHYECACGEHYDEKIEPHNHHWIAVSGTASEKNKSYVEFRCSACGMTCKYDLGFIRNKINSDSDGNMFGSEYELDFKNKDTEALEQPDDFVDISISLDEFDDLLDDEHINVYRVNDDGSRELMNSETDGHYVTFKTNHFSKYVFEKSKGKTALDYDVDGNGKLDTNDYSMLVSYINGEANLTDEQKIKGDLDGDGVVDGFDAVKLSLYLNGYVALS